MGMDGYSFFIGGLMTEKKRTCYIGMISLTMVVNSTNLIIKFDSDFIITIL